LKDRFISLEKNYKEADSEKVELTKLRQEETKEVFKCLMEFEKQHSTEVLVPKLNTIVGFLKQFLKL
jgi:hypothetical protein